jgi:DNA invertase Pin-like site-specific DNA recombinase
MNTTAIYLRVSNTNGQKFDSQLSDLKRWIEVHKPEKVIWYEDKFTGKTMDRPGMQKLITDLHASKLKNIVCWRLDRLGRTASGLTKLFEELWLYKCNLISLKDNLDLSTPAGRLNANIIASVAAYETEVRGERVKAGQQAAKSNGKKWGGSRRGHRKAKTREKAEAVIRLHQQGASKAEISRAVGLSVPTISDLIN